MRRSARTRFLTIAIGLLASFATPGLAIAHARAHQEEASEASAIIERSGVFASPADDHHHDHPSIRAELSARTQALGAPASLNAVADRVDLRETAVSSGPVRFHDLPPPWHAAAPRQTRAPPIV